MTKTSSWIRLQPMNGNFFLLTSMFLACLALQTGGCVTDHEGTAVLKIVEFPGGKPVKDSLLLTIRSKGLESQSRLWIFEDEDVGQMIPRSATVTRINTGDKLHQEGNMVTTLGPYARSKPHGWEYWVFHEDYQPEDFMDIHFDRACENKKPLQISLPKATLGNAYSDEKMLDGARKFCGIIDFLPSQDPDAQRLFKLVARQLSEVKRMGRTPRDRKEASELLEEIEKNRKKWTTVSRFPEKK